MKPSWHTDFIHVQRQTMQMEQKNLSKYSPNIHSLSELLIDRNTCHHKIYHTGFGKMAVKTKVPCDYPFTFLPCEGHKRIFWLFCQLLIQPSLLRYASCTQEKGMFLSLKLQEHRQTSNKHPLLNFPSVLLLHCTLLSSNHASE